MAGERKPAVEYCDVCGLIVRVNVGFIHPSDWHRLPDHTDCEAELDDRRSDAGSLLVKPRDHRKGGSDG